METLLILKSKCQQLGKDFEGLKINIGKGRRKTGEKGGHGDEGEPGREAEKRCPDCVRERVRSVFAPRLWDEGLSK